MFFSLLLLCWPSPARQVTCKAGDLQGTRRWLSRQCQPAHHPTPGGSTQGPGVDCCCVQCNAQNGRVPSQGCVLRLLRGVLVGGLVRAVCECVVRGCSCMADSQLQLQPGWVTTVFKRNSHRRAVNRETLCVKKKQLPVVHTSTTHVQRAFPPEFTSTHNRWPQLPALGAPS